MSNKEEQPKNKEEEETLEKTPFMMTIPAGESFAIDFAKHEEDACLLMHAARLDDKTEAKLIIKYDFYKQNPEELTDQELKTAEMETKEDVYVFNKGQKEITLEYTFYEDLNPFCEAQGSEIRIDGIFAQEVEEEEEDYEEEQAEGEEEQGKEAEK